MHRRLIAAARGLIAPLQRMLVALWVTEPVRVVTALVAAIVFAAAKLGVVLDPQDVEDALLVVLPILLGGELARRRVSPAAGETGPASDELLDL